MDGETEAQLRAQLATLTAAVTALSSRIGPQRPASRRTFSQVFDVYIKRHWGAKWTAHEHYKRKVFLRHFGERVVEDVTKDDWYYYRDEVRGKTVTRMKKLPAAGTLNQDLFRVQAMLRWAVREELIGANPWEGIKRLPGERARRTEIAVADLLPLLLTAPLLPAMFCVLSVEVGMRRNEIRLMEWKEIDFDTARHRIPAERTKTGKARTVPLSELAMEYLQRWRNEHPPTLRTPKVFTNPNTGDLYSPAWIWAQCRLVLDKLEAAPGDGRVRLHDGRHTVVSRLARGGMATFSAMKIVGHEDPSQHWRYHHIDDTDRAAAKRILDADRKAAHTSRQVLNASPDDENVSVKR